jgi:hypothetical protein
MTEAPPLFEGDRQYLVRSNFVSGSTFEEGEILRFVRNQGYSPYDDAFFFEFRTVSGETKLWVMPAGMLPARVHQFFKLVD